MSSFLSSLYINSFVSHPPTKYRRPFRTTALPHSLLRSVMEATLLQLSAIGKIFRCCRFLEFKCIPDLGPGCRPRPRRETPSRWRTPARPRCPGGGGLGTRGSRQDHPQPHPDQHPAPRSQSCSGSRSSCCKIQENKGCQLFRNHEENSSIPESAEAGPCVCPRVVLCEY